MTRLEVRIEPFEPLLFGDNRSARAGQDHALADQDPSPATVYGIVGARIAAARGAAPRPGEAWERRVRPVLGPFEPDLEGDDDERAELLGYVPCDAEGLPWFPRPAHLEVQRIGDTPYPLGLLRPEEESARLPSSLDYAEGDGPRRLVASHDGGQRHKVQLEEAPLLVDQPALAAALSGGELCRHAGWARYPAALSVPEYRLGLAVDNDTSTAIEGRLFARPYRRFPGRVPVREKRWRSPGYLAWYRVPGLGGEQPSSWSGPGFAGGDRGRAFIGFRELRAEPLEALRDQVLAAVGGSLGFLVCLLTPAVARQPWPEGCREWPRVDGRAPVAAALGRPSAMSGWCGGRAEPRPLRTLLGAGTVFFYQWGEGEGEAERRELLTRNWLAPLDPAYRNTGFGRMLTGVWR